jgi:heterodisulfide reductase subunit B
MVLDAYQYQIEARLGERFGMPILYFTQLMGVAMGIDQRHLGFDRLFVSPARVLPVA